jgi:hypothetical protein
VAQALFHARKLLPEQARIDRGEAFLSFGCADALCYHPKRHDNQICRPICWQFVNTEGILSFSPGLRGTRYPGSIAGPGVYPGRVVALRGIYGHDPFRVVPGRNGLPSVARRLATLGFETQSLQDWRGVANHPVGGSTGSEVQSALDFTDPVCVS